ncbi:CsgG/HfaB family protein [Erythrobacter sanguineus]|uniref:Curli production assembly/transport component CsgG n=1 Tax=Erythrobacter sanguineus TaxID=198312 RepID=A0A1M7SLB1_9SPHN|nr:CsgG/HfaB family protein [Erythrobacter sanguineus]SHN59271.1 curli production assembly/transport component CsgG [Erythrobacter sanguineus]
MRFPLSSIFAGMAAVALTGCMSMPQDGRNSVATATSLAYFPKKTQTQNLLHQLPGPQRQVAIAVYGFTDQTGQFKPSDVGQTLSRAVTQGASAMLVKALQDAGNRSWFTVVERERLDNLLRERQIIGEMRKRYLGEQDIDPNALPALLFAGVLLEGGIVGYDTNTVTGGAGAAFLGIGARTEYRQDTVTVYLRAVSVRTGEVLANITTSKTIASQALGASAFKFVAFRELLEAEAGITSNEPDQVALQQAIEKAVYGLVLEGVELDLWRFEDMSTAQQLLAAYRAERDGVYDASDIQKAVKRAGSLTAMTIIDADRDESKRDGS